MTCSRCGRRCRAVYDSKVRTWRHSDFGPWAIHLRFRQRRVDCPRCKAVVTEVVPWAEVGSAFTRDFEDVTSFLVQQANKTAVARLMRISWPTVGNIVQRTVAQHRLPLRMRRLYRIGIDEISYRRHHKYLTLVADHDTGEIVWGGEGKSGKTLDGLLDELGDDGRASIELVSMDMAEGYIEKVRERLSHATIVFDPFHVVRLANMAVDEVRRAQVASSRAPTDGRRSRRPAGSCSRPPATSRSRRTRGQRPGQDRHHAPHGSITHPAMNAAPPSGVIAPNNRAPENARA